MKKWKIQLSRSTDLGIVTFSRCVEAANMDLAIAEVKALACIGQTEEHLWTSAAQTFSDVENSDPLEAERIFVDSGDFNAYLKLMV